MGFFVVSYPQALRKSWRPETVLTILVKSLLNQKISVMIWKCMACAYLAGPGPSQCNLHEYTLQNLSFELGMFQSKEHAITWHGQYLNIADSRGMWMNDSNFFYFNLNIEGIQWFSFLIKKTLIWWIIAWLFAISRNIGETAMYAW